MAERFCPDCGQALPDSCKFCPKCGIPIEQQTQADQAQEIEQIEQTEQTEQTEQGITQAEQDIVQSEDIDTYVCLGCGNPFDRDFTVCPYCGTVKQEKKAKIRKIIISAVAVLAVFFIVSGTAYFVNYGKNSFGIDKAEYVEIMKAYNKDIRAIKAASNTKECRELFYDCGVMANIDSDIMSGENCDELVENMRKSLQYIRNVKTHYLNFSEMTENAEDFKDDEKREETQEYATYHYRIYKKCLSEIDKIPHCKSICEVIEHRETIQNLWYNSTTRYLDYFGL